MPYIYQITFDILYEDIEQLQIGNSMQLSLAYLRALLPNEAGFISSRAMYSITHETRTHIIFESEWEDWETLDNHRNKSPFDETKMLSEFEMKVKPQNLSHHIYEEVG